MAGSVIVPLYIYPSMGAWNPIFDMATSYPQINFTAVVNVHSGPGDGALPNAEYSHAIETLNSFNNVRTVGYVSTAWCARDLNTVLDDIAAYSFWGEYQDSLAIDGIFVDETPTQYSTDSVSYLQTIAEAVHESDGLKEGYIGRVIFHLGTAGPWAPRKLGPDDPCCRPLVIAPLPYDRALLSKSPFLVLLLVHNPGALPAPQYFEDWNSPVVTHIGPDMTIVFENSFTNWSLQQYALADATKSYNRTKLAVVVHSVPDLSVIEIGVTLMQLLAVGQGIWLTGDSNYSSIDQHLPVFIESLAALLA